MLLLFFMLGFLNASPLNLTHHMLKPLVFCTGLSYMINAYA